MAAGLALSASVAGAEENLQPIEVVNANQVLNETVQEFADFVTPIIDRLNPERVEDGLDPFELGDFITEPDLCWEDGFTDAEAEGCEEKVEAVQIAALDLQIAQAESRVEEKEQTLETSQASVEQREQNIEDQERTVDEVQSKEVQAEQMLNQVLAGIGSATLTEAEGRLEAEVDAQIAANPDQNIDRGTAMQTAQEALAHHRATLNQIEGLFTESERQQVFGGALSETVSLNFAASNQADIYANVFTAISAGALSDDRKRQLQEQVAVVIGEPDLAPLIRNGADMREAGRRVDEATGEYLYTSQQDFAKVRPGVGTYMNGDRQMLFLTESGKARDITGMPDHAITTLAEVWAYYQAAQDVGATGFLESLGATHYDFLSDTSFDWLALRQARDIISKLSPGLAAGRDGTIADPRQHQSLLRAQMRVLAGNEQALGMQSHEADTQAQLATLGLIRDGKPDFDVLEAFGAYSQEHYLRGFTRAQVQAHLHKLYPNRVDPPADATASI